MTQVRSIVCLGLFLASFACATPSGGASAAATSTPPAATAEAASSHDALVRNVDKRYPKGGFIVGYGSGETPEMAEDHARVNAAKAISDVIDANLSVVKEGTGDAAGHQTSTVHVTDEIRDKVVTDAGPFIEAVHELTQRTGGNWEAVAVIDRERIDQKYGTDADRLLNSLVIAWDKALAAADATDASGAVAALCGIDDQEKALDKIDFERKLVTRRPAWTADATAKRHKVDELRSKLKGSRVNVYDSAADAAEFSDSLVKKLVAAGFQADLVKDPHCMTGGGLLIQTSATVNCEPSSLGQKCEAELGASSQRCGSSDSLFDERSAKGTGLHATDTELARKFALRKLDSNKFVDTVAQRVLVALEGGCKK